MNIDISDFHKVKEWGEEEYKKIPDTYCPYLEGKVQFSAQGIEHLRFKNRERPRKPEDQYMRFKLIKLAPEVISKSKTVQGILETRKFESIKVNKRKENVLLPVKYFEFIAVLKRNRVKVIVKQIDNGSYIFWSIIPFWKMDIETMKRILYEGSLEED